MRSRLLIPLILALLAALLSAPSVADAAGARFRVLNAASSGVVTVQVNGKTKISRLKLGRASRRIPMAAGRYTFTAIRPPSRAVVAQLSVKLGRSERVTIVFAMKGKKPQLLVLRERKAAPGAIYLSAGNFASAAGAVDFRAGGLLIGRKVGFGKSTTVRKIAPAVSPTGLVLVSARRGARKPMTSADPLVLATGTVGMFALIPRGSGAKLVRLPYDTPPPAPLKQPVIKGTQKFGSKVRCVGDAWRPKGAKVVRRWTVDGVAKASAASPLTLATASHAGHRIGCSVSATSKGMTTTASASFVLPAVPTPLIAPSVRVPATALVAGSVVSCNVGTWSGSPANFAVRWVRVGTGAVVATGRTHTLTLADNGARNSLGCDVVATNAGGPSAAKASANTVALGIAPTVTIIARPGDITESTVASFQLAIGGGGADTIECRIDKAAFLPCTAAPGPSYQLNVPGVNGVDHTFDVRVTNPVSSASANDAWKVVPLTPTVLITAAPPSGTTSTNAAFTWTLGGGEATVTCKRDGDLVPCATATTANLSGLATSLNGTTHTFEVTASNANPATATAPGAKASHTWIVNPPMPTVTITSQPPNPTTNTTAAFAYSVNTALATVTCKLDTAVVACGPTSASLGGLTTGVNGVSHTFVVTVANATATTMDAYSWVVRPPAPTVAITSGPPDPTTNTTAAFAYSVNTALATVTCKLDTAVVACGPTAASLSGLSTDANGVSHTFQVTAANSTGTATDSYTWTVDPPAPTVTITAGPTSGTTSTSANFAWTLGGGPTGAVTCRLDGNTVPCATPTTAAVSGLSTDANGVSHTFQVTATNANAAAGQDSYTWTVNPPAPTVSNVTVSPGDGATSGPFDLNFTVDGPTTSVTCTLDTAAVSCANPFSDPGAGEHTIVVTATNVTGPGTGSVTWTYG